MKVKKDDSKNKKKKSKIQQVVNTGIKKSKKIKKVKVENDTEVGETIKKDLKELAESQSASTSNKSPQRVERWNSYLKAFLQHEKLNKKQKLLMEFCTNKSITTPRRKARFLKFVRNCYNNQADVSDELVNELFDTILLKYTDYKLGKYHNSDPNVIVKTPAKLVSNKKKKAKRFGEWKANSLSTKSSSKVKPAEKEDEEKWTKVKSKKRKPRTPVKTESNMETDN